MEDYNQIVGVSVYCHNCEKVFYCPIGEGIDSLMDNLSVNGCQFCSSQNKENKKLEIIQQHTKLEMDTFQMVSDGFIKSVRFDDIL